MTKQEFITELRSRLSGLPEQDIEERLNFYCEMIDDRTEEGLSEEEAISDIGTAAEIAKQIIADIPFSKIAKERIKPKRRLKALEITLLALGSPIWLSLAIAAFAVILSLYAVIWSVLISLLAIFTSLLGCAIGVTVSGIVFSSTGNSLSGIAMIGTGIFCAGVSIFAFFGCKAATKGILLLTKRIALGVKKCFIGKENAQ